MSIDRDLSYVYDIFNKIIKYDEHLKRYVILKTDYLPLNLSNKQLNILRKMCKRNNVLLENDIYYLPDVEDEALFDEYNKVKRLIDENPNSENIKELQNRKIELRNKIALNSMKLVKAIIDRNFDGIHEMDNKDEIYQLGYTILLSYMNRLNIVRPKVFTLYLSSKLISDIKEKLLYLKHGYSGETILRLKDLQKDKMLLTQEKTNFSITDLARQTGEEKKKVEELLTLESLLDTISIDEEIEKSYDDSLELHDSPLYDYNSEKRLLKNATKEVILKIISTLPEQQREILMLHYGFKDGRCYNDIEIGKMYGVTNTRIGKIRQNALKNLKLSLRSKFLREVYDENETNQQYHSSDETDLLELEDILIQYIPKEELSGYLANLEELERKILVLYYGLETETKYHLNEISELLNISQYKVYKSKRVALQKIKDQILDIEHKENKDSITQEEYLEYLIKYYILSEKAKKKH